MLNELKLSTADIIAIEDQYQIPTYTKFPLALVRGEGSWVWDADGNKYLDFYGGHCVAILGHCPPKVVAAISNQAQTMMFYSNLVYSDVRAEAAKLLAQMSPEGLQHVFFCNAGTEANETALKLARKVTGRSAIISTIGGFHGRTLGSLAVTYGDKYHKGYEAALPEVAFVPFGELEALEALLQANPEHFAAFILEPIQSIAGITQGTDAYYQGLRALCDQYGVKLIFDEVQTGVGRTGTFSISEAYGMKPDLITLAKSLGAGIPVGAVLVSDEISATIQYEDQGTTFGGGMLAMAAVKATLESIRDEHLMAHATEIHARIKQGLEGVHCCVIGRGCLIGIDVAKPVGPIVKVLREKGVIVGGSANPSVMRVMPPVNATDADVDFFVSALREILVG